MEVRFGIFQLDGAAGELRRNGTLVRLPPQPFQVLHLLARSSGEVVDRDRIRREVWGETAVDFDRSLNVCIAQIRAALNDDADNPRFIQTLPKKGYRFLASVEPVDEPTATPTAPLRNGRTARIAVLAVIFLATLSAAGYWLWRSDETAIRIAVLPFGTVGGSAQDDIQTEGLFDELLTGLGGIQPERLRVIGRTSVTRFRNNPKPLREIREQLKVSHVLEGTVRVEEKRRRIALRLVDAGNETVLWSETFTQDGGPGEFEEQFAARASAAVLTKLFPDAQPPTGEASGCREGWEAYRTGQLLANRGRFADLQKSIDFFERANCAPGRAALAEALIRLGKSGAPGDWWERARTAARQALDSDLKIATAHVSLANVAFWRDWDWKKSDSEYQIALRNNPSDAGAHHDLAWLLMALGRKHEALASLQRAIALDPLSPRINMDAGWLLLQAGRFQEAAAQARRTLELEPEMKEARACLSRALLYAGDDRAAIEALRPMAPELEMRAVAALPPAEAIRTLFRGSIRPKGAMDPYQRAWRLAWIGSREEALAEVEEALRKRSMMMPLVAVDPAFASLRNEARFRKVVHDLGL